MAAAIGSTAFAILPGVVLAQAEDYQWRGKGGGALWAPGSGFFPKAAIAAFCVPYAVAALQLAARVSWAGFFSAAVGAAGLICVVVSLLAWKYSLLVILGVFSALLGPWFGVIGALAAIPTFIYWQFRLVQHGSSMVECGEPPPRAIVYRAISLVVFLVYIGVWATSLGMPDRARDARSTRYADSVALVAAAMRAKLPVGKPLELLRLDVPAPPIPFESSGPAPGLAIDSAGNVYEMSNTTLLSFDAAGRTRWRTNVVGATWRTPVFGVDPRGTTVVYVGEDDGRIYGVRGAAGALAWSLPYVPPPRGFLTVFQPLFFGNGDVLVGAATNVPQTTVPLLRLSSDGATRWRANIGNAIAPAFMGRGDTIYVASREYHPRAIADFLYTIAEDGRIISKREPSRQHDYDSLAIEYGRMTSAVTPGSAVSVIPFGSRGLLGVHEQSVDYTERDVADTTHARRWSYPAARVAADEHVVGVIANSGDRATLVTTSRVVVLRISDGTPLSEYVTPGQTIYNPLSGPVLGPDGAIYVADRRLRVHVLRDTTTDR